MPDLRAVHFCCVLLWVDLESRYILQRLAACDPGSPLSTHITRHALKCCSEEQALS